VGVVNQPENLLTRIRDLERQVRELRRGSLYNAAISQGGLEVRTPDGDVILRAGEMEVAGQVAYGLAVYRRNGTLQARFFDTPGGGGYFAFFDEAGNVVMSNDTVSGRGLATPYIPWHWTPWSEVVTPPLATTSAAFEVLARCHAQAQNPRLRVLLIVKSDADTTGEIVLAVAGVPISPVLEVQVAANNYLWLHGDLPGNHLDVGYVDLQARRTAGTGAVRATIAWTSGVQS
jgi:hypothetical protein